jgi:hypothetical protein
MRPVEIQQLSSDDLPLAAQMLSLFAEAFHDPATYNTKRPRPAYLQQLRDIHPGRYRSVRSDTREEVLHFDIVVRSAKIFPEGK